MTPERLVIRDLFGVREADLAFEGGVVAIVGPNGAGKSSLLDALLVALFGEPSETRTRRLNQSGYVRVGADRGEVAFTFRLDGGRYRISRTFFPERKAQRIALAEETEEGWTPLASSVKDAESLLAGLLDPSGGEEGRGIAALREAFCTSVLVPQGAVTELVDKTPADRWKVLAAALGLQDEQRFRERAQKVKQSASQELARIQWELDRLQRDLEGIAPLPTLRERRREAGTRSDRLERALEGIRKAEKARSTLDERTRRLNGARHRRARAERDERRCRDRASLSAASEGLRTLRERASRLGRARSGEREARQALQKEEGAFREQDDLLQVFRDHYRKLSEEKEKQAPLARYASCVAEIRWIHDEMAHQENEKKRMDVEKGQIQAELEEWRRAAALLTREELLEKRRRVTAEHKKAAAALKERMDRLLTALTDWLELLAGDADVVELQTLTRLRAVEMARTLADSGLSRALEEITNAKARCHRLLRQGLELHEGLRDLPAEPLPEGWRTLSREQAEEKVAQKEKAIRDRVARRDAADRELVRLDGKRTENARRLPDRDEAFLRRVEAAAARTGELDDEMQKTQIRGGKTAEKARKLGEQRDRSRERAERAGRELDEARRLFDEAVAAWKKASAGHSWSREELLRAQREEFLSLEEGELERAAAELQSARDLERQADGELRAFRAEHAEEPPPAEELERTRSETTTAWKQAGQEIQRLEHQLESRARAEGELADCRARRKRLQPASDAAERLAELAGGRKYVRFVQDRVLAGILDEVNRDLPVTAWTLAAEDGELLVRREGETRPVSSLSGGERSMVALAILRSLAAKVGFRRLLFVDEGLAMLDDSNLERVVDLLSALGRDAFVGVITHDPDVAAAFAATWQVESGRVTTGSTGSAG